MPIIKSAQKAARQTDKRTAHNKQIKKDIKLALKAFKAHPSAETFARAQSEYDKAAKKGLIKKNTASRRKSSLVKLAKAAGLKPAAGVTTKTPATPKATTTKTTKPTSKAAKPTIKSTSKTPKTTKSAAKATKTANS